MSKRVIAITVIIVMMFVGLTGRIGYIVFGNAYTVADTYNNYCLTIDNTYTNIYYRDFTKANNNKIGYVAVIRPNEKSIGELNKLFTVAEVRKLTDELKKGYPIIVDLEEKPKVKLNHIYVFESKSDANSLNQLINKSSNGIYNHIDNIIGKRSINFSIDARGRLLEGDKGTESIDNYYSPEGYVVSINKDIQGIVVNATSKMRNGCVVVMDTTDSSILACVNKPDNSYLIKSFSKYAVGSVFKLVIASCALENNMDLTYNCKGKISVGELAFSCQDNHIHGTQSLKQALANSCNCYFVNLANTLGKDRIQYTLEKLGFYQDLELFDNWKINGANLPTDEELSHSGELSLLGFGQGKLLVSPLQICSFLCTVSNGGMSNYPRLFLYNVNNQNKRTLIEYPAPIYSLSKGTCDLLLEYMRYVVSNGTGQNADTALQKSAGKTATAQTGQYILSHEYLNTWFAGVYPCDNPKYAIVILNEKGKSGAEDCCPIFRTIVEQLENM